MKWALLLLLCCPLGCRGGGGGFDFDSGSDGDSDSDSDGNGDSDSDTDAEPGEPSFGTGSYFDSAEDMLDYVNERRQSYSTHERYKGLPFAGGGYHTNVTWPMLMEGNDSVAADAQGEADAVAGGASPRGFETESNPGANHLFMDGVNTGRYMVTGMESGGVFSTEQCTMCNSNPFARMAVFYHDPGGDGPVLTSVGVGASAVGADTWWVLIFE